MKRENSKKCVEWKTKNTFWLQNPSFFRKRLQDHGRHAPQPTHGLEVEVVEIVATQDVVGAVK